MHSRQISEQAATCRYTGFWALVLPAVPLLSQLMGKPQQAAEPQAEKRPTCSKIAEVLRALQHSSSLFHQHAIAFQTCQSFPLAELYLSDQLCYQIKQSCSFSCFHFFAHKLQVYDPYHRTASPASSSLLFVFLFNSNLPLIHMLVNEIKAQSNKPTIYMG